MEVRQPWAGGHADVPPCPLAPNTFEPRTWRPYRTQVWLLKFQMLYAHESNFSLPE